MNKFKSNLMSLISLAADLFKDARICENISCVLEQVYIRYNNDSMQELQIEEIPLKPFYPYICANLALDEYVSGGIKSITILLRKNTTIEMDILPLDRHRLSSTQLREVET